MPVSPCQSVCAAAPRWMVWLLCCWLGSNACLAQFGGGSPFSAGGPADFKNDPKPRRTPHYAIRDSKPIVNVFITGRQLVDEARIRGMLQTRPGRDYDPEQVQRDVRTLVGSGLFRNVRPYVQDTEGGVNVTFEVSERPLVRYVKFVGNVKKSEKKLLKQVGIRPGDPLTRFNVEEGRRRLQEFYMKAGYSDVQITALEGTGPNDQGVVYQIHEGTRQRIASTKFEGNTIASDARLKTQVLSKPGFLWLFGGNVIPDQIEQDYARLTTYYRSLGFLNAKVSSRIEWNADHTWASVVYVIDEGPRFRVREIKLRGNQLFDTPYLMSKTETRSGDYFNLARLQRDLNALRDEYGGRGYIFADIDAEPQILEEPGWLDIEFKITEGEQYRVGRVIVNIDGEERHTRRNVVLNRLSVKPGDVIDLREIRASERRLMASQLFNVDPAQGPLPSIAVQPPKEREVLARQPTPPRRTFRGQSDEGSPSPPAWHQMRKPVTDGTDMGQRSIYEGIRPATPADPNQPPRQRMQPSGQPYGAPVQPLGAAVAAAPPGQGPVAPVQWTQQVQPPLAPAAWPSPQGTATGYPGYPGPSGPVMAPGPPPPAPPMAPGWSGAAPAIPGFSFVPQAPVAAPDPNYLPPRGSIGPVYGSDPRFTDIIVNVQEAPTGRLMIGAAVNSDAGLTGQIIVDERNFDWRRIPRSWDDVFTGRAFRGAGQQFRVEALPGSEFQRYAVSFTEPFLMDTRVSLDLSAYLYDRRWFDWDEGRIGGIVGLGYRITPDLSISGRLRLEEVEISDPRIPGVAELDASLGRNDVYGARVALTHDTRDSPFAPTQGHFAEFSFEQVFGNFDYPRGMIDWRRYFLVTERADGSGRQVLSFSNRLGITGSETPIFDNFFAGGYSTLRGFEIRGASPADMGVYVGGEFMFLGSVEYLFPITADDMLKGVVFVDYGTVEADVEINPENYRVALGAGFRISIPAMGPAPIAIDFAVPVARADTDDIQNVSFFLGVSR